MGVKELDCKGLRCPQPTLKLTTTAVTMKAGEIIEVIADCPTFEKDVKDWCTRMKKVLVFLRDEGPAKRAQIKI